MKLNDIIDIKQLTKHMVKDEDKMQNYVTILEYHGYREGFHFFVEEVFDVDIRYEAVQRVYATRTQIDNNDIDFDRNEAEITDKIFQSEYLIGHVLVTDDYTPIDLSHHMFRETRIDECAVCGVKLVTRRNIEGRPRPNDDKRMEKDGLKCFDCRGVEVDKEDVKWWKRKHPELPIVEVEEAPQMIEAPKGLEKYI